MSFARETNRPVISVGGGLRTAAGVIFSILLVVAPLNFGSTRAGGPELVAASCILGTVLWLGSQLTRQPRVPLPRAALASAALLVVSALPWITGLASFTSVAAFTQTHFAHVVARWPFSIVWRTPGNTLVLILALTAALFPLIDLTRTRSWALCFSIVLTITAAVVGILALLQNYTHATGIYWRDDGRMPGNFCGTFFHHTAAGAYFNTAWPLAITLTWLAWDQLHRQSSRAGFSVVRVVLAGVASIILLAAQGSHVSRFPQVAALIVAPFLLRSFPRQNRRPWLLIAGAVGLVGLLVALAGRTADIGARWRLMFEPARVVALATPPPESAWPALIRDDLFIPGTSRSGWFGDRGEGWHTALRSIAERPWFGHGPGNWMGAASHHSQDPFVRTFFQFLQFAHQDVLQFAVEWGIPAALGWWGLLVGALITVIRARHWLSPLHRHLAIAAACGLAAVLVQAQLDFPLEMPAIALNVIMLAALCWANAAPLPLARATPAYAR